LGEGKLFEDLLSNHIKLKQVSPNWRKRNNEFKSKIIDYFGERPIEKISGSHIEEFFIYLMNSKGLSIRICEMIGKMLRQFFTWCVDNDYLYKTPKFKIPHPEPYEPRPFSTEELKQIYKAIHLHYQRQIIDFILNTGLRIGELTSLMWSDVDLKNKILTVVSNTTHKTKTRKSRQIPLNQNAMNILLEKNGLTNDYVFTDRNGNQIKHPLSWMYRLIVRAGIKTDEEQQGFHRLRHTFATRLREYKVPTEDIKELLGHQSITTTLIYAKYDLSSLKKHVKKIERVA
jgi:integrase